MSIEGGTAIVLTYLLVSIGVIVAFVGAVFMVEWFISWRRERRDDGEKSDLSGSAQCHSGCRQSHACSGSTRSSLGVGRNHVPSVT